MKKTLLAMMFATFGVAQANAQANLPELQDELQIMTSILQTALKQNNDPRGIRFRSIDTTYLANQGVVFEIQTIGSGGRFSFDLNEMIGNIPVPVVAPPSPGGNDRNFEFIINNEFFDEHDIDDAMEEANNAMQETRERLRELRDREREFSYEQRDYERRKRDLEFEKSNADEKRRKELGQELQELEKENKEIASKREELNKYASSLEAEQKKKLEQRNAAKQQQYKQFLAGFEASIGQVMSRYGAGLKAMADNENVNFILPGFDKNEQTNRQQDRIYVFKNKDIKDCVKEKISMDKLLSGALSYAF
jgi:DNA segregation ATPase FtsK/SpoIIIE-like protein